MLVLSKNVFNEKSGTVIAVALTSQPQRAGFPLTLELIKTKNLPKRSWAKISQIRTLSVQRVGERISSASEEEVSQIVEGLNEIIGA
jgi:mRNA interferase MazF